MGPFTQLISAQTEISVVAARLSSGPAAVPNSVGGAVAGKSLNLSVDLKAIHRVFRCVESRHQRIALGRIPLDHLFALDVAGDHRLLGHAALRERENGSLTLHGDRYPQSAVAHQLLDNRQLARVADEQDYRQTHDQQKS